MPTMNIRPMPPGMRRALEWLQNHPTPISAEELAGHIHVGLRQAQYILRQLHTATPQIVHIAAWRKETGAGWKGRPPIRLWAFGHMADAPRPPHDDATTVRARRVQRLRETYGFEMAQRILYDRVSTIHSDGHIYHKRHHGHEGGRARAALITETRK